MAFVSTKYWRNFSDEVQKNFPLHLFKKSLLLTVIHLVYLKQFGLNNKVNKHLISRQSCILSLSNLQTLDYIFCAVDSPRVKGQRRKRKVNIYVKCCVQFVDPFSFILYCVVLFIVIDIDAVSLKTM